MREDLIGGNGSTDAWCEVHVGHSWTLFQGTHSQDSLSLKSVFFALQESEGSSGPQDTLPPLFHLRSAFPSFLLARTAKLISYIPTGPSPPASA